MSSPVDTPPNPFRDPWMADKGDSPEGIPTSNDSSQPGSAGGPAREKKRVGFIGGGDSGESSNPRVSSIEPDGTVSPRQTSHVSPEQSGRNTPGDSRRESLEGLPPRNISKSHLPELSRHETQQIHEAFGQRAPARPRPAMRRRT